MVQVHYKQFRQYQKSREEKVKLQIPPARTDQGWHIDGGLLLFDTFCGAQGRTVQVSAI